MKTRKPVKAISFNSKPTYSEKILDISSLIAEEAEALLNSGSIDTVEASGRMSLASLLDDYANGQLDKNQSFNLLKTLADKKTSQPVQRIEQHTIIDMRALIADAVIINQQKLDETIERANRERDEIQKRLGTDTTLRLADTKPSDVVASEPDEIKRLRSNL